MKHWNTDNFKKISSINSKNRKSSNNGEGPSLHIGRSVAFDEYRRRYGETTNQVLREDELYLKIHRIKDDKWICGRSERVWNTFTRNTKQKVSETSTTRNEDGFEVQERDVGLNRATEENEAQECNEDNNILTLLQNIPKEQVLNTWIDTIGGAKKGRVYGLGSKTSVVGE
ncbi:uncharacterized protein LOC110644074 [Hevea brasiliensis]|uniref:uncharacterized protein LOC110644074 n=1 Tax=Hevea brasiliensis TaxID=3981 RepID=UPI0025E95226|nr:uncharacterized protein LOC110644074 [Hevea brasiliensis]